MASPVKYMVVHAWYGYKIIDTSMLGNGKTLRRFVKWYSPYALDTAHLHCRYMNFEEGFSYGF